MQSVPLIFLNCESTCDLTDVLASIYDRKRDGRPFYIIHDILRCLSFLQSHFTDRNAPIWRIGNRRVKLNLFSITDMKKILRKPPEFFKKFRLLEVISSGYADISSTRFEVNEMELSSNNL